MLNFLVQTIDGKIAHDFVFEMTQAKEFYDWLGKEQLNLEFSNTKADTDLRELSFDWVYSPLQKIPIGSVEFVSAYLRTFYPNSVRTLAPINVPDELFPFAKRRIVNVCSESDMDCFGNLDRTLYRKSMTTIKDPSNGPFNAKNIICLGFQVSEPIEIQSEWRVFVFHNQVQHIANYSGESLMFPDPVEISRMVEAYRGHAPAAYTLDVGVGLKEYEDGKRMETFVIEVHRFFSCGLYGFSNHQRIPKMLSQTWYEMKTNKKL